MDSYLTLTGGIDFSDDKILSSLDDDVDLLLVVLKHNFVIFVCQDFFISIFIRNCCHSTVFNTRLENRNKKIASSLDLSLTPILSAQEPSALVKNLQKQLVNCLTNLNSTMQLCNDYRDKNESYREALERNNKNLVNLKMKNSKQLAEMDATILNFQKTVENLNEGGNLLNRSAVFSLEGQEEEIDDEELIQLESSIAREQEMEATLKILKDEYFSLKEQKVQLQENLTSKSDNEDDEVVDVKKVNEIASVPFKG